MSDSTQKKKREFARLQHKAESRMEEIKEIENLHSISEDDDTDRAADLQEGEVKGKVHVEQHRVHVSVTPELIPKEFKAFDKRISSAAVNTPNELVVSNSE